MTSAYWLRDLSAASGLVAAGFSFFLFNDMSRKLAEADTTRRQFLADASHELKSPSSSIEVLAQSLLDSGKEEVAVYREFLRDIDTEIDRLSRLVSDMLELARLEK